MPGSWEKFLYRIKWSFLYRVRKRTLYHRFFFHRLKSKNPVRLHIGCGHDYLDGWVNIDQNKKVRADLYMDIRKIRRFCPENSVDELLMVHVISYLRFWEARDFLSDCLACLKKGGRIVIEAPDIHKLAREILAAGPLEAPAAERKYMECMRAVYAFNMEQISNKEDFTTYAFGWSAEHLALEMKRLGFTNIRVLPPQCHDKLPWRDFRIEASK